MELFLANEQATLDLAKHFAQSLQVAANQTCTIFLQGDLGAGKTCFSRGLLQALGHVGSVKSPTYTLVEPYDIGAFGKVFHFDFYRLSDPEEALYLGLDDYWQQARLCLIEWPEKAKDFLPKADVAIVIDYQHEARNVSISFSSKQGEKLCKAVADCYA